MRTKTKAVTVNAKVEAVNILQSIAAHAVLLQAYVLSGTFDGEGDGLKTLLQDLNLVDTTIHNYG